MRSVRVLSLAVFLVSLILLGACRSLPAPSPVAQEAAAADSFALVAELDRLAATDLWPGFDPRAIPVAVYDGERTLLFRHPSPPSGFVAVPGRDGVVAYHGRHPQVTANTGTQLGGVWTATLMPSAANLRTRARVLVHETFHVYQRQRHPGWQASEADLFTYPVDDTEQLTLARLEIEALRRALTGDPGKAGCWGHQALELRRERFATLPEKAVAYERGTEWNEGLAAYVESRAGRPDTIPSAVFPPEAVRQRSYATGAALARLLDRFSPDWRSGLERDDTRTLDALLADALAAPGSSECRLEPAERERVRAAAAADVAALRTRRDEQRGDFLARPGWTLVIAAPGPPLLSKGFDPLNVQVVRPGEVLHTRYLKLGNAAGEVEVIGRSSLSEAAGAHPLFDGVRRLIVTGLPTAPEIAETDGSGGALTVKAEGLTGELRGATVERDGKVVTIRLPEAQRVAVGGNRFPVPFDSGWAYLDLPWFFE